MDIELHTPSKLLGLINKIWLATSGPSLNYQMLPEACVSLAFNLVPGFQGLEGKLLGNGRNASRGFCFLSGMHAKPINAYFSNSQAMVVELHPLAVYSLFGIPCDQLKNTVIEGDLILSDLNRVEDKLLDRGTFLEKAKWLEDYLYSKINETSEFSTVTKMNATFTKMHKNLLAGKQVDIQAHTGYSRMHTHRLSTQWLGLAPKKYLRLQQFTKALNDLHSTSHSFAEVATSNGFYDQTHFNRVFRDFTDMTPLRYRKKKSDAPGQLFF